MTLSDTVLVESMENKGEKHTRPSLGSRSSYKVRYSPHTLAWSSSSWIYKRLYQAIQYPNQAKLNRVCSLISDSVPLVSVAEIKQAQKSFSEVARGNAFIIQGGDCAESFDHLTADDVSGHLRLLSQQAHALSAAMGSKEIIQIGRIAGQYAKPRSNLIEVLPSGETVSTFRGHNINSEDPKQRTPDPSKLLIGHIHASTTLATIAKIRKAEEESSKGEILTKAQSSAAVGALMTSHEAIHLPLESALTRGQYNVGATFLWVGERTRQLDSAHLEYIRGLRNPIGIKVGPTTTPEALVAVLDALRPDKNSDLKAHVAIITRVGAGKVAGVLAPLIRAAQQSGHNPIWLCDPCHGNTESTPEGYKTRRVSAIVQELKESYMTHKELGSRLGGIHLEQCGSMVTECLDSERVTCTSDLREKNLSLCDPRLAEDQAQEVINQFVEFVKQN